MEFEYFETLVQETAKMMPERFKKILKKENIPIIPREKVPEVIKSKYKDSIVFGIFTGIPYNKRSVFNIPIEPTRIELYKESFEKMYRTEKETKKQIVSTIIHEIGHYFGFDEEELKEYQNI